jgi:uncharacterized membrane protein (UPF0127 family)
MKRFLVPFIILLLLALIIGGLWYFDYKYPFRNITAGDLTVNGSTFVVEVANDPRLRSTGLGGRDKLDPKAGMLFVFSKPGLYEFWMKDMKFPLDLIWISHDWKVVDVTQGLKPETYPKTVTPKDQAQYVVEVNAGVVATHGITVGDKVYFEAH